MIRFANHRWLWHLLAWPLAVAALTVVFCQGAVAHRLGGDFMQFWSAAQLLARGENPYDPALQVQEHARAGWDINRHGLGRHQFLPYYYPPWLAIGLIPLLPLGYLAAKAVWLALLVLSVVAAGLLFRPTLPDWAPSTAMAATWLFGFWWMTLPIGQTAPVVVLLLALFWQLAESRRDRAAGCALALLTLKPQLTAALLLAVVVWIVRQRRGPMLYGMLACGLLLAALSTCAYPAWLPAMLRAPYETPLLTTADPRLGATWLALLRTAGLQGAALAIGYALAAAPVLVLLFRTACNRSTPLLEVLGLGTLAAFVVVPYARYYDLPIVLPAVYWVLSRPTPPLLRSAYAAATIIVPPMFLTFGPVEPSIPLAEALWLWLILSTFALWLYPTSPLQSSPALSHPTHPHLT